MTAAEKTMLYFPLSFLNDHEVLVMDLPRGILSHLAQSEQGEPLLIEQVQFTANELAVVLPLLQSHPYYCPDEVLWASFNRGQLTDTLIENARQRLIEAKEAGTWDHEMRPLRNILSRARFKLKELGLGLGSIIETGYLIISLARKPLPEKK